MPCITPVLSGTAGEAGEDDGLFGSGVFENAEDFDLKLFDAGTGEDSATGATEPGLDFGEGEEGLREGSKGGKRECRAKGRPATTLLYAHGNWFCGAQDWKRARANLSPVWRVRIDRPRGRRGRSGRG